MVSGGMDMNGKTKFLIVGLLLLITLSFFVRHFWSYSVCALQHAVAGMVPLVVLSKFFAGIVGLHFLL